MSQYDQCLIDLARRVGEEAPLDSARGREILESALRPMVRVAMRGVGQPWVVNWVRGRLDATRPADPARDAPPLARELCERVLSRCRPQSSRETVVGP